ncbi:12420_t:CDS:10 [Entrophospora sp. SA101]|nr:12420_t:CDS:10 [Entrophospora sp. SA101]
MSYMSEEERSKLKHPNYWDREPNTWGSIKDWDFYLLKNLDSSQVNKRISHSALGGELRCLKQMYDENHPIYKTKSDNKIWKKKEQISSLLLEADVVDLELEIAQKRGRHDVHQIARRGYKKYSDIEFGLEERVQKKIKPNENNEEEEPISSDVSLDLQSQAQQRTPERQFSPLTVPEIANDEPQPICWEFDEPMPTWLEKVVRRQEFLTSQTDPSDRYESSLNPIWWRIIDASDLKSTSDFLTEADMSDLVAVFASALNVGHPTEDWTTLEPSVERCLQALAKLDNDHLSKVGKIVALEGFHGAILEIQKMVKNVETSSLSVSLFDDEDTNDKVKPTSSIEEEDYLNPDVQFILDLIRFTCEMLAKGIPQRKNSERDIDVFIKRHLFSCFDNILDSHFGEMVSRASRDRQAGAMDAPETAEGYHLDWMFTKHDLAKDLPYGREFSLCERTGSRIENERKILSNTLKAQKTLRDMHRTLVEAISVEGGGMLSKQVLRATTKLLMPGFLSHCFFIRAFLVVYIGGGFYSSIILADFDIPSTYSELGSIIKVSRIMLRVKVGNNPKTSI